MVNIKVFSTETCHFCVVLKQFLDKNKVEYESIDLNKDQEAAKEFFEKGFRGVPITIVEGHEDDPIVGFDEEKIKEQLGI